MIFLVRPSFLSLMLVSLKVAPSHQSVGRLASSQDGNVPDRGAARPNQATMATMSETVMRRIGMSKDVPEVRHCKGM